MGEGGGDSEGSMEEAPRRMVGWVDGPMRADKVSGRGEVEDDGFGGIGIRMASGWVLMSLIGGRDGDVELEANRGKQLTNEDDWVGVGVEREKDE